MLVCCHEPPKAVYTSPQVSKRHPFFSCLFPAHLVLICPPSHPLLLQRSHFDKQPHSSSLFPPISDMSDRTTWGEKAHLDLLLALLNNVTIPNSDWDIKIMPELRAKGYTFTASAALYELPTPSTRSHHPTSRKVPRKPHLLTSFPTLMTTKPFHHNLRHLNVSTILLKNSPAASTKSSLSS